MPKRARIKRPWICLAKAKKLGLEDKVDVQKIHDIINSKKKKQVKEIKASLYEENKRKVI